MARDIEAALERWRKAGLLDPETAERLRSFEAAHRETRGRSWPVFAALGFGVLMLGAGVLLFVAAHWDDLSPASRFSLVLLMVGVFHVGGAAAASRIAALATALHALGTVVLGAGIFLTGQIFHLQEHWPGGIMLWALGAWIGWALRRDFVQAGLAAVLTPAWLAAEWGVATENYHADELVLAEGILLLAVVYFTAQTRELTGPVRRTLKWIGGFALLPAAGAVLFAYDYRYGRDLPAALAALGWSAAFLLPLALAAALRRRGAWIYLPAALWIYVLGTLPSPWSQAQDETLLQFAWRALGPFLWTALGSVALMFWGVKEERRERINFGIAGFALSVLMFYFSGVMDKLGRSASLIGLGVLFLVGGWLLERTRRRLIAGMTAAPARGAIT